LVVATIKMKNLCKWSNNCIIKDEGSWCSRWTWM